MIMSQLLKYHVYCTIASATELSDCAWFFIYESRNLGWVFTILKFSVIVETAKINISEPDLKSNTIQIRVSIHYPLNYIIILGVGNWNTDFIGVWFWDPNMAHFYVPIKSKLWSGGKLYHFPTLDHARSYSITNRWNFITPTWNMYSYWIKCLKMMMPFINCP